MKVNIVQIAKQFIRKGLLISTFVSFDDAVERRDVVSSIVAGDGDELDDLRRKSTDNMERNSIPMAIQNRSVNPRHCI